MQEIPIFLFLVIFLIQILFFVFAAIFRTDKVTDLAYGTTFVFLVIYYLFSLGNQALSKIVLTIMISLWGLRLSGYLFYRILKIGKDKRFDGIRENVLKFASFWFLQTITIWVIILPSIFFLTSSPINISAVSVIGGIIWATGFLIETVADLQQNKFYSDPKNKDLWNNTGLWKHSRHPNYFGEILCWIGICVYIFPRVGYVSLISPAFITFLLLFVSGIPPTERKSDEKYKNNPNYWEYKKNTSVLIPLP